MIPCGCVCPLYLACCARTKHCESTQWSHTAWPALMFNFWEFESPPKFWIFSEVAPLARGKSECSTWALPLNFQPYAKSQPKKGKSMGNISCWAPSKLCSSWFTVAFFYFLSPSSFFLTWDKYLVASQDMTCPHLAHFLSSHLFFHPHWLTVSKCPLE